MWRSSSNPFATLLRETPAPKLTILPLFSVEATWTTPILLSSGFGLLEFDTLLSS
jgi:hypothetical protein